MRRSLSLVTCAAMLVLAELAIADVESGSKQALLCAIAEIKECIRGQACTNPLPDDVNAPDFFRVDLGKNELKSTEASGEDRVSPIKYVERLNGKLVLQGVEPTSALDPSGVGWTISIDEQNGRMVGSASGALAGVIMFGACLQN